MLVHNSQCPDAHPRLQFWRAKMFTRAFHDHRPTCTRLRLDWSRHYVHLSLKTMRSWKPPLSEHPGHLWQVLALFSFSALSINFIFTSNAAFVWEFFNQRERIWGQDSFSNMVSLLYFPVRARLLAESQACSTWDDGCCTPRSLVGAWWEISIWIVLSPSSEISDWYTEWLVRHQNFNLAHTSSHHIVFTVELPIRPISYPSFELHV